MSPLQLVENGTVTKMGINVTLAPMEELPSDDSEEAGGADPEPGDLPEKENSCSNSAPANTAAAAVTLSGDEIQVLKQCRSRAYAVVNRKKRMHLNASLSQHVQKEWLAIYPESRLTGKRLLELFETHSINAVMSEEAKKSNRGRKRKVPELSLAPAASDGGAKSVMKKSKSSLQSAAEAGTKVVSESSHEDRQWSEAMLRNLMYCNNLAMTNKTDLETEWLVLYPNSLLTARNLKSRLTVYQRTHSEKSAPKKPTLEKVIIKAHKIVKSVSEPPLKKLPSKARDEAAATAPSSVPAPCNTESEPWTEQMAEDMFCTLDLAREELGSTDNEVIGARWHQLWLQRNPASSLSARSLYNRYLVHVKKASQLSSLKTEGGISENGAESEEIVDQAPEKPVPSPFKWNDDLFEDLQREQKFVEDKLRCIQDDYFFELLQERWNDLHPECKDSPEDLRNIIQTFTLKNIKPDQESTDFNFSIKTEASDQVEDTSMHFESNHHETKDTIAQVKSEADVKVEEEEEFKTEPVETVELPRSKWVCAKHYIHVFYDDQDKSHECILTEQLLQIRTALVPQFPGADLFKSGKKPPGFAKMLLGEWLRYYPESQENTKTISMKIGRYDRAPQMLVQETKSANGRINWSPAMIENIRATRDRALQLLSAEAAGAGGSVSRYWRQEWEQLYPGLNIDWKQVVSRYHYHFGAERRDSADGEITS